MSDAKTKPTGEDVVKFLESIEHPKRREDSFKMLELMGQITGEPAKMWGPSIVGFGSYHFKYESGRQGDFLTTGFSPRKSSLTLYIMAGFSRYKELMGKLGKYKTGKSCLYIKKLEDVDMEVLEELIRESVDYIKTKTWP